MATEVESGATVMVTGASAEVTAAIVTSTPVMRPEKVLDDWEKDCACGVPFHRVIVASAAVTATLVSSRVAVPPVTAAASPA
ncbi:hypothetical protein GCM10025876_18760 [Demequina litorisediminis]|uniref:Uncharacterized protein n=1 Tax=Demequina litorisediminis TaxID=1849022 RepID=A0ABQ6IES5_9MICO|nr:hypothetical protein GCM10025876_18760 [Demequina litorisediminis]